MNRLSNSDRSRVIACLVEGNSIRATVRITGVAKNSTITVPQRKSAKVQKWSLPPNENDD